MHEFLSEQFQARHEEGAGTKLHLLRNATDQTIERLDVADEKTHDSTLVGTESRVSWPNTMRKQELIHIHGLLAVTRNHLADREGMEIPADAFDAYDDYAVGPTAIANRKDAHKEAVEYLLDGLHATRTTQQKQTLRRHRPTPSIHR